MLVFKSLRRSSYGRHCPSRTSQNAILSTSSRLHRHGACCGNSNDWTQCDQTGNTSQCRRPTNGGCGSRLGFGGIVRLGWGFACFLFLATTSTSSLGTSSSKPGWTTFVVFVTARIVDIIHRNVSGIVIMMKASTHWSSVAGSSRRRRSTSSIRGWLLLWLLQEILGLSSKSSQGKLVPFLFFLLLSEQVLSVHGRFLSLHQFPVFRLLLLLLLFKCGGRLGSIESQKHAIDDWCLTRCRRRHGSGGCWCYYCCC
mmetsp:Transcript_31144/g.74915  ORF Transcript_31144/g.74915 Transcript_31144/m.74915 type:complete len:255 (-) Transcript_31144:745-1509(-)